jgi:UDP-glucose 4-epimerase
MATHNLLEAARASIGIERIVFASSSTIYGEAKTIPTPEDYGPLNPISLYGSSKLSGEALLSAYASLYGFKAVSFRLANIVGSRSRHGVIYDFYNKLISKPEQLEVLGDGSQSKSYLFISDCIKGMLLGAESQDTHHEIYNLGSMDRVNVLEIAEIVKEEMGLKDTRVLPTGGIDGGRGWEGDVKRMLLDTSKLQRLGWKPEYSSAEAVRLTARNLMSGG